MQLIQHATYEDVSKAAAREIAALIREKPEAVLGLATGSTPLGMYEELIRIHREEGLDLSQVTTFNLDEYYGLDRDHEQSYYQFMQEHFFQHVNIPQAQIHIPDGNPDDVDSYCREYEDMVRQAGGIDLQVLGIGTNGHIGFNEPADELIPHTHLTELASSTVEANARFFSRIEDVPRHAITMGMSTIMQAKRIMLLATGKTKAPIVKQLMTPSITTRVPASLLWLHGQVQVYVDEAAAAQL